jgi:hypothetical protein
MSTKQCRIEWKFNGSTGHGVWQPATDAVTQSLNEHIKQLCSEYGKGSHWLSVAEAPSDNNSGNQDSDLDSKRFGGAW